jgi:hypothetical protein
MKTFHVVLNEENRKKLSMVRGILQQKFCATSIITDEKTVQFLTTKYLLEYQQLENRRIKNGKYIRKQKNDSRGDSGHGSLKMDKK